MANEARFEVYPRERRPTNGARLEGAEPTSEFCWRFHDPDGRFVNANEQTVAFKTREDAHQSIRHFLTAVGADHEDSFVTPPILDVEE